MPINCRTSQYLPPSLILNQWPQIYLFFLENGDLKNKSSWGGKCHG